MGAATHDERFSEKDIQGWEKNPAAPDADAAYAARITLDLGQVTLAGVEARSVKGKARLDQNGLNLERFTVGDLGGAMFPFHLVKRLHRRVAEHPLEAQTAAGFVS